MAWLFSFQLLPRLCDPRACSILWLVAAGAGTPTRPRHGSASTQFVLPVPTERIVMGLARKKFSDWQETENCSLCHRRRHIALRHA